MAIANGYCTLAEFRAEYKKTTTTGVDDNIIEALIESASRYIDNYCGRFFYTSTGLTVYYTPSFNDVIYIDDFYGLTTLKTDEDGDGTYENTWNTGQNTGDFYLMPFNASILGDTGKPYTYIEVNPEGDYTFPKAPKGVQIVGDFGWAAVPADIKVACLEIVNASYGRRSGQNMAGIAEVTAAGVVLTPADIPQSARGILRHYRRIV